MPADQLWGAKIQRSLEHFSIGDDREIITAYAILTSFEIAASSNCKKVRWRFRVRPSSENGCRWWPSLLIPFIPSVGVSRPCYVWGRGTIDQERMQ